MGAADQESAEISSQGGGWVNEEGLTLKPLGQRSDLSDGWLSNVFTFSCGRNEWSSHFLVRRLLAPDWEVPTWPTKNNIISQLILLSLLARDS